MKILFRRKNSLLLSDKPCCVILWHFPVTMYHFVKPETQSNRESVKLHHLEDFLETDSLQISGHLARQAGQQTTQKHLWKLITENYSGGSKCVFREPVNLMKTSSCQIISSLQAYLFPSLFMLRLKSGCQPASESSEILAIARGSFCPQKKFYTVHHSIPMKTSMIYSIVS